MPLDETDWAILKALQDEARLSYSELGRRVGLSSPAVQERVRKLEDIGIIEGYHARVNYSKLGLPIMSITRLLNVQGKQKILALAEIAKQTPEIIHCVQVMGQDEYILTIVAPSVQALEAILGLFTDHAQSISSIVIKAPVDYRSVDLENFPYLAEEQEL